MYYFLCQHSQVNSSVVAVVVKVVEAFTVHF